MGVAGTEQRRVTRVRQPPLPNPLPQECVRGPKTVGFCELRLFSVSCDSARIQVKIIPVKQRNWVPSMAGKDLKNDKEACNRAENYKYDDPFPSIPVALLSSAEIYDYAHTTGMLCPFFADGLKSASYEAHAGGKLIRWESGEPIEKDISCGDEIEFPGDSISFVEIQPKFRLPNYIAIRFNLRITLVHRGLLLGTGPLVDPGFEGKILVPIHNLTSSSCKMNTRDALIWIEFTKTTYNFRYDQFSEKEKKLRPFRQRCWVFHNFPDEKKNKKPHDYLHKANSYNPIESSIPKSARKSEESSEKARQQAEKAQKDAEKTKGEAEKANNIYLGIGGLGLVAVVVALISLFNGIKDFEQSLFKMYGSEIKEDRNLLNNKIEELRNDISKQEKKIQKLEHIIENKSE